MADWREPRRCERCRLLFEPERWSQRYCPTCKASCSVAGCDKPVKAGTLCAGHRWRLIRHGDPGASAMRAPRGDPRARGPQRQGVTLKCEVCKRDFYVAQSIAYVEDHVDFAIDTLKLYSNALARKGYRLLPLESAEATEVLGTPSFADFDASEVIRKIKARAV